MEVGNCLRWIGLRRSVPTSSWLIILKPWVKFFCWYCLIAVVCSSVLTSRCRSYIPNVNVHTQINHSLVESPSSWRTISWLLLVRESLYDFKLLPRWKPSPKCDVNGCANLRLVKVSQRKRSNVLFGMAQEIQIVNNLPCCIHSSIIKDVNTWTMW